MSHDTPHPPNPGETTIVINEADGDQVVIRDRADDDVGLEVSIRHENGREVIEVEIVDLVDVEQCGRDNRCPPLAHRYRVKIDGQPHIFETRVVTGRQVLEKAGKTPVDRYELEKRLHGGHYVAIGLEDCIDLGEKGIEVFETFPLDETEG